MRNFLTIAMMTASVCILPAAAQAQAIEGRVDRLESEMRAVQRKVFPGGAAQMVQPEITGAAPDTTVPGTPSNSAVVDLDARVNALESQMTGLTSHIELAQHRLQLLEDAFEAYKRATDGRLKALEAGSAPAMVGAQDPASAAPPPTVERPAVATTRGGTADKARQQKLAAIEKPVSDDPAEDGYIYGYRLWQAGLYPEAEVQLRSVVKTYPRHRRASYAQNLLGRAFLDEGKPSLAAIELFKNYKTMPDGDRAPDSLYFLAQALMKLDKPKPADACQVYHDLNEVYGAKIDAALKADVARGRAEAKCQ